MYIRINVKRLAILLCFIFSVAYIICYSYKQSVNINYASYKRAIHTLKQELQECETNLANTQKVVQAISKYKQTLADAPEFTVTAYDLSFRSTGKYKSSRGYGRTKIGFDLRNKTWQEARTIAVDERVIPLGSAVYVYFLEEAYKKYSNVFIANDTGSAIVGEKIDFFLGDYNSSKPAKEVLDFGVTKAKIILLK